MCMAARKPLCAKLHFNIINLVNAAYHQIDLNVCWTVHGVYGGWSYPSIVNLLVENCIQDSFLLEPLVSIVQSLGLTDESTQV